MASDEGGLKNLELLSIIGFDGTVVNGLKIHPDGVHLIYPLGNKVAILHWTTKAQSFLSGHTNAISTIAVSPNGKYVASGQVSFMGFKAAVILWDFEERKALAKYEVHKVRVESVTFSRDNAYLMSLGGRDDGNVVVWNVKANEAICGSGASAGNSGDALVLCATNIRNVCFLSGGENTLRMWRIKPERRHVTSIDVKFGMIKRHIMCVVVDSRDEYAYCGTTTGDIVKARLNYDSNPDVLNPVRNPVLIGCYGKIPKRKTPEEPSLRYSRGVTALALIEGDFQDQIVVGGGDGALELVKETPCHRQITGRVRIPSVPQLDLQEKKINVRVQYNSPVRNSKAACKEQKELKAAKLDAAATSLQFMGEEILAGTNNCEIYTINKKTFKVTLHVTCHTDAIFDVAFPYGFSECFGTASKNDIRVWSTSTFQELLRISVTNFTCSCLSFSPDGKVIISGWNDGVIRVFTPVKGRMLFEIINAHNKGVSALKMTDDCKRIISGGIEGEVRIWELKNGYQVLLGVLREHKAPVTSISLNTTNTAAVSSSTDGTCIIWDISRMRRSQVLFANTQFMCASFSPSGVQILTTGTDRKIGYWEVLDGSQIRELEGSGSSALNTLAISSNGSAFATGGCDQFVKYWNYKEGKNTHIGVGHAGVITAVCFSADNRLLISVSSDGGIFVWKAPYEEPEKEKDVQSTTSHSTCTLREREWNKDVKEGMGGKCVCDVSSKSKLGRGGKDQESIRSLARKGSKDSYRSQISSELSADASVVSKGCPKSVASSKS